MPPLDLLQFVVSNLGSSWHWILPVIGLMLFAAIIIVRRNTSNKEHHKEKQETEHDKLRQTLNSPKVGAKILLEIEIGAITSHLWSSAFRKIDDAYNRYGIAVHGKPDMSKVSTSYIERQNLTMRMGMRRFTRLTNGFSKKVDNLKYNLALHYMFYNYAGPHKSLATPYPRTPAMAAGIADHIWTMEEIVNLMGIPTSGVDATL